MAVGTLGSRQISEFGQITVQAQPVSVGQIGVTVSAAIGKIAAKLIGFGYQRIMALMTIGTAWLAASCAARRNVRAGSSQFTMLAVNTSGQSLSEKIMTNSTAFRHVGRVQRGSPVRGVEDPMGAVTIGTDRRHHQAGLHETLAMNALLVRLEITLMAIAANAHLMVEIDG